MPPPLGFGATGPRRAALQARPTCFSSTKPARDRRAAAGPPPRTPPPPPPPRRRARPLPRHLLDGRHRLHNGTPLLARRHLLGLGRRRARGAQPLAQPVDRRAVALLSLISSPSFSRSAPAPRRPSPSSPPRSAPRHRAARQPRPPLAPSPPPPRARAPRAPTRDGLRLLRVALLQLGAHLWRTAGGALRRIGVQRAAATLGSRRRRAPRRALP